MINYLELKLKILVHKIFFIIIYLLRNYESCRMSVE